MKRKLFILGILSITLLFTSGCISSGVGSANFDLGRFFGNPIVIIAVIALIIWMWSKGKK